MSIHGIFRRLKASKPSTAQPVIPILQKGLYVGSMRVVTEASLKDIAQIKRITRWRKKHATAFPSVFPVSVARTRRWAKAQLMGKEDRILFMIYDLVGQPIGHIGLYRYDTKQNAMEVDNVVRGEKGAPGIMSGALLALEYWARANLHLSHLTLRVFEDNTHAVSFYKAIGYKTVNKIPLLLVKNGKERHWIETSTDKGERFFLQMKKRCTMGRL